MILALLPYLSGISIFLLIQGVYHSFFKRQEEAKQNIFDSMEVIQAGSLSNAYHNGLILKDTRKKQNSLHAWLALKLEHANLHFKPTEYLLLSLILSGVVYLFALPLLHHIMPAVLAAAVALLGSVLYLNFRIWKRLKKAEKQFPDVLDTMANCFKTGFGLHRAFQVVAAKYSDPWSTEFEKMNVEINLGASLESSLENLNKRIPINDVELFVMALLIQKETGGNMSELLSNMSRACRNRHQFMQTIKTLSAQGKLSAAIVSCLPFGLMIFTSLLLPKPVHEFVTNPIGLTAIILSLLWMLVGIKVLYSLIQVEV